MPSLFPQGPTSLSSNTEIPEYLVPILDPANPPAPIPLTTRQAHLDIIAHLTDDEASRIWTRCLMRSDFPRPPAFPTDAPPELKHPNPRQHLLAALQRGADQADIVLALVRDPRNDDLVERLVGKPITRPTPVTPAQRLQRVREARGQTPKTNLKFDPTHHVRILVAANPKRPGSDPHRRFDLYIHNQPVQLSLDAGVTPADVRWDLAHNFIALEAP